MKQKHRSFIDKKPPLTSTAMDSKQDIGVDHREDVDHHGQPEEDMRPWYHQPELRKLYLLMPFLFLGSTTLGYDGSLLNGLQTMPAWKECMFLLSYISY